MSTYYIFLYIDIKYCFDYTNIVPNDLFSHNYSSDLNALSKMHLISNNSKKPKNVFNK